MKVNLNTKSYLSYLTKLSDVGFHATAGIEYQKTDVDNTLAEARMFPSDDLKTLASAAEVATGTSSFTEFSFLSYFSRSSFGTQKTGNFRAQFLLESLADLKNSLQKLGVDLLIVKGKPGEVLPEICKKYKQ